MPTVQKYCEKLKEMGKSSVVEVTVSTELLLS